WTADPEVESTLPPPRALIAWTFLQGYAEYLADHTEQPAAESLAGSTPYLCPACSARPLVGVLRPLGDGRQRSLICPLSAAGRDGVGVPAARLPGLGGGERREAPRLRGRRDPPRPRRGLRPLPLLHQDDRSHQGRPGGAGGGRAGGDPAQPVGRRARLHQAL